MRLLHTRLIMAVEGLLIEHAAPTRGTDRDYLSGNLCRCGTYKEVMAAVESSSQGPLGRLRADHESQQVVAGDDPDHLSRARRHGA